MMTPGFDPRTQRLSYRFSPPKPYKLPRLTEIQLAVLACARDNMIRKGLRRFGHRLFVQYKVFDHFDVTTQVRSLTKRRLMKWPGLNARHDAQFILTSWGLAELAEHPEF
jgi:hypothetical protein